MTKADGITGRLRRWAHRLKTDIVVLSLAMRDPEVSFVVKILAAVLVAYTLSPIDLIPDFIPVLGYLDDLILVPAGIALCISLIPEPVMVRLRIEAETAEHPGRSLIAAGIIVAVWIALGLWLGWLLVKYH